MAREISCSLSPIRIYTDMSRPGSRVIPVGFVAELVTPEYHVMGLVGRANLDSDEMNALHGLLRHRASQLWDFLVAEFDLASGVEPGKGLEYLAARHSFALSFETPEQVTLPQSVTDAVRSGQDKLAEEFRSFLWDKAKTNGDLIRHEGGIKTKIAPPLAA
jgi:hypothetical protein